MIYKILIIGAGPAGLTAAWEAEKLGVKTLILEGDKEVGGISRTVERNGWKFDIGGHRFFTKVDEVYEIWDEILEKDDFLLRPRMSRIYYKKKFYDFILKDKKHQSKKLNFVLLKGIGKPVIDINVQKNLILKSLDVII